MNKKTSSSLQIQILTFFSFFIVFVLFWFIFKATTSFATSAPLTYTLLAELPGIDTTSSDPTNYLSGAIKLIIGLTTVLSVLMIVYAGIVGYVGGATNPGARSAAKTQIEGALLGLTLALVSYIILNEINPDLLSLDLSLPSIPAPLP